MRRPLTPRCGSCRGYGHFGKHGKPSTDKRDRKCLDCNGEGHVSAQPSPPTPPDASADDAAAWIAQNIHGDAAHVVGLPERLAALILGREQAAREAGRVEAVAEVVKYVRAVADAREDESMPRTVFKTLHGAADAIEHKFTHPDRAKGG